jgi:hypothetical protein
VFFLSIAEDLIMATYRAKCWLGSSSGYQELEVQSNTPYGAKEQFQRIYGAEQIINLREVRSDSNSSGSGVDFGGTVGLIGLVAAGWAFFTFTPWILMCLGGVTGTWIGQKVTGQTLEDYNERDDGSGNKRAAFVVALALILGGIGFVKGDELKKEFDAPTSTPTEIKKSK